MTATSEGMARRAILAATALGAFAAAPQPRAEAASHDKSPALLIGLFADFSAITIPNDVVVVQTSGHSIPSVGAARYVFTKDKGPAPHRAASANGRWFELAEALAFVEMFGALGGEPEHDDGPAIQATIDYVASKGGGVVWCTPGQTYYLGQTIIIDPTRVSIEAGSAVWDFRLKPFRGRGESSGEAANPAPKDDNSIAIANSACILVRVPPNSTQYGQDSHYCRGLKVKGSPSRPTVADGFYFDTPTVAFSSRWTFYNVEATDNLGRGLVLRNRAYLAKAYASSFAGFHAGVEFLGGEDAGENFSFFGGNLGSGGGPALKNNGGEFYLFGVSADFPKSFIHQTGGAIHCFGCHFETGERAHFEGRPFDIAGDLYINGGQIMGGAPLGDSTIPYDYFFYASEPHTRIILNNVWGYNWQGAAHVMCGGPGRFVIERILGGSNWNIPGIVKRDPTHSLLGDAGLFERTDTGLDLWVAGQGASRRLDRNHVIWSDNGRDYASVLAERTSLASHSGASSLAFTKNGVGVGTGAEFNLLVPFPPGGNRLRALEFWVKPLFQGGGANGQLFTQLYWANIIQRDSFGVPIFGQTQYCGEAKLTFHQDNNKQDWSRLAYGDPLYADPSDPSGGYAPVWATYLWLHISLIGLPPMTLFLDDIYAFAI